MDREMIRKRDREPVENVDRAVLADEVLERVVAGYGPRPTCPICGRTFSFIDDEDTIARHIDSCSYGDAF